MINTAYVRTMAAYNSEVNARVYAAAERLTEDERRRDRGAFFRSIHGTLSHLVWADKAWMARFAPDVWAPPQAVIAESGEAYPDFEAMAAIRAADDAKIVAWAGDLAEDWLAHDQAWYSAVAGREMRRSRAILVIHLFNHQTHHRGQVHAMLTAAGEASIVADLPFIAE